MSAVEQDSARWRGRKRLVISRARSRGGAEPLFTFGAVLALEKLIEGVVRRGTTGVGRKLGKWWSS